MRSLLALVAGLLSAVGLIAVQSWTVQVFHDSCRLWHEPPAWSYFCPPSTRHGATR